MSIRNLVETTLHDYFAGKVDRSLPEFEKLVRNAVLDCEVTISLLPIRDKESVIGVVEAAVKDVAQELRVTCGR